MESKRPFSFNVEELQELILQPCSSVRSKRSIRHIALHPSNLGDLKAAIKKILNQLLNKFDSNPAAKENTKVQSPKKKKHKKDSSIENSQDEILVVPEVEVSNKRKRDSDDDVDGTRKKKKNRRKREEAEEDDTEQFNSLHMSSEDPEYGQVIEHIKTAYLNESVEEETPKKEKDKKKHKKRKLHTTLNESVEIKNQVDSAEQVESKKKKQTEKHESEETTSVVPKYNQLWENFQGRNKKLEESLASWNTSSLGFEQMRQSLQNQKDTVKEKDKKKHKKRKLHTTLNESVEITNEVDAAEQVESKKKKQTEKHESEETTSIVPKYNQLWENFKGRSKKLEESLASCKNSSLGSEQLKQSLQNPNGTEISLNSFILPDLNGILKVLGSPSEKDDKTTDGAEKLKTNKKNEDSKKDKKKKDKKHKKKHGDEKIKKKERKGNNKNKKDELSDLKKLSDSLLQKFLSKQ
ncbi:hypothetical protein C0J52_22270 [Blattella germanica]|nr:hypothetical protein C0J52_22270 [Blattella germanica]